MSARPLALAALLAAVAGPAPAHNPWIKPSAASVAGADNWVTFDAAVSTDPFVADHQPMRAETIHAFGPDGQEVKLENAATGRYRTTFDLHLTQPGTYRIATMMNGIVGSYTLNGEPHRVGGRGGPPPGGGMRPGGPPPSAPGAPPPARFESGGPDFKLPAGATDVKLGEMASRTETFVTLGKPSAIAVDGRGLELQPISHPDDLVADEPARFRFLIDGKPAAGIAVKVIPDGRPYRDAVDAIALTTDAKGEVAVKWPKAGLYWLNAATNDMAGANPIARARRLSYATTLEVLAP